MPDYWSAFIRDFGLAIGSFYPDYFFFFSAFARYFFLKNAAVPISATTNPTIHQKMRGTLLRLGDAGAIFGMMTCSIFMGL